MLKDSCEGAVAAVALIAWLGKEVTSDQPISSGSLPLSLHWLALDRGPPYPSYPWGAPGPFLSIFPNPS